MNVLKAKYEILTPISEGGTAELKHIERIGRVCYKSEDKITEDGESARKFVDDLEHLPELSKEELEDLSERVRVFLNKNK